MDPALLFVLPLSQVLNFTLIEISEVLFREGKFLSLSVLEFINLFGVLKIEFSFDLIVG